MADNAVFPGQNRVCFRINKPEFKFAVMIAILFEQVADFPLNILVLAVIGKESDDFDWFLKVLYDVYCLAGFVTSVYA